MRASVGASVQVWARKPPVRILRRRVNLFHFGLGDAQRYASALPAHTRYAISKSINGRVGVEAREGRMQTSASKMRLCVENASERKRQHASYRGRVEAGKEKVGVRDCA
eukprot:6188586-Pleurochrysis_carterae.AAC.2